MEGLTYFKPRVIQHPQGNVLHGIKSSEKAFSKFGELYFSRVKLNEIKGWKKHTKMISQLFVTAGEVKFVIYDGKEFAQFILSENNHGRLTIAPNLWLGFQGLGKNLNIITNLASIEHDPKEALIEPLNAFKYEWGE